MNFTMRERQRYNAGLRGLRGGVTLSAEEKSALDPDARYWERCFRTAERQLAGSLSPEQWDIWVQAWNAGDPNAKTFRECYQIVSQARALAEAGEQVTAIVEEVLGGGS